MLLKIIGIIVVVISGTASFLAKRVISAITKHEAGEEQIIKFKLLMLALVIVGALAVILPDYL